MTCDASWKRISKICRRLVSRVEARDREMRRPEVRVRARPVRIRDHVDAQPLLGPLGPEQSRELVRDGCAVLVQIGTRCGQPCGVALVMLRPCARTVERHGIGERLGEVGGKARACGVGSVSQPRDLLVDGGQLIVEGQVAQRERARIDVDRRIPRGVIDAHELGRLFSLSLQPLRIEHAVEVHPRAAVEVEERRAGAASRRMRRLPTSNTRQQDQGDDGDEASHGGGGDCTRTPLVSSVRLVAPARAGTTSGSRRRAESCSTGTAPPGRAPPG